MELRASRPVRRTAVQFRGQYISSSRLNEWLALGFFGKISGNEYLGMTEEERNENGLTRFAFDPARVRGFGTDPLRAQSGPHLPTTGEKVFSNGKMDFEFLRWSGNDRVLDVGPGVKRCP